MNFNSPNDLQHFLVGYGIVGICPEAQNLVACMDVLARMCSCDPVDKKQEKLNQCKQNYIAFASRAKSFSHILFDKVPNETTLCFYLNKQLITTINR